MGFLIDTSVLMRVANATDEKQALSINAIEVLRDRGDGPPCVAPQNLIEFRNASTRPTAENGMGLTPGQAATLIAEFEARFTLLLETPEIYPAWKALVAAPGVIGKQVHDARLVAACQPHRFNPNPPTAQAAAERFATNFGSVPARRRLMFARCFQRTSAATTMAKARSGQRSPSTFWPRATAPPA